MCNDTNRTSVILQICFGMKFFYLRHHYLSVIRSKSIAGETFAFVILTILFGGSISFTYGLLDHYALELSNFFGLKEVSHPLILMVYLFIDLVLRLIFRRPLPKLKYYALLNVRSEKIVWQYLIVSLFGIIPFLLGITMLLFALKAGEWLGPAAMLAIFLWWLANHWLGLVAQFSTKRAKPALVILILLTLLFQFLFQEVAISQVLISPVFASFLFSTSIVWSYFLVKSAVGKREISDRNQTGSILDSLPVLSFKNPVFQLEWALLARNKRTRSNLLLGLLSVIILPYLISDSTRLTTLIFFITTGFFIIQHGVYSLGWEGTYFDFMIINISPKRFIKTRYIFYVGTCLAGLVLVSIPTLIRELNWINLFCIFLFNIGVTIPIVLYRSTFHDAKIVLTENSFMNYNGMMTGPIFVTSFLIMLTPLFVYGIGTVIMGESAYLLFAGFGLIGLSLFHPITNGIAKKYYQKKYHLSQSFKA